MASKRLLKKSINNLCFDLISECYVYAFFHRENIDNDKINGVMADILKLRNDMVMKINNPEYRNDRKKNRKHFSNIAGNMQKMVDAMDKLSAK